MSKLFLSRLKELQGSNSVSAFARYLEMPQKTVDTYIKEQRKPSVEFVTRVCSKCHVSADWLLGLSDQRSPFIEAPRENKVSKTPEIREKISFLRTPVCRSVSHCNRTACHRHCDLESSEIRSVKQRGVYRLSNRRMLSDQRSENQQMKMARHNCRAIASILRLVSGDWFIRNLLLLSRPTVFGLHLQNLIDPFVDFVNHHHGREKQGFVNRLVH